METKPNNDRVIDGVDCQIIRMLQHDGRMTNIEIARKLSLSEATVRARMKRLIEDEVIRLWP